MVWPWNRKRRRHVATFDDELKLMGQIWRKLEKIEDAGKRRRVMAYIRERINGELADYAGITDPAADR